MVPFIGPTRLLVRPGMAGATGNIYCGLHEFEEMGFVLHFLSDGDLFMDVGANIGSYTILASGVRHVRSISVEPLPTTFASLLENVRLNRLDPLVVAHNKALGSRTGVVRFTSNLDTVNHVAAEEDAAQATVEVELTTLDVITGNQSPALIKIDVEGFETEVLAGATSTLSSPKLCAVLIETNSSGRRYGASDEQIYARMAGYGFMPFRYTPFERRLTAVSGGNRPGNTIFVRELVEVQRRVAAAPGFDVVGLTV